MPVKGGVQKRMMNCLICLILSQLILWVGGTRQTAQAQAPISAEKAKSTAANSAIKSTESTAKREAANMINENQLSGLPLNGRSYSQLATLEAGVSDTSSSSAARGVSGGNLTVSGSRSFTNNFMLDGTTIMNSENQAPKSAAGVQLGSDTVFQVQVFSTGYQAEYGRSSGGILNSITRSGTPQWHGTLFEYFRNSKLDSRNFFDRDSNPPPFKRNQFGFTLTGPLRKDRTFVLISFEGLRDRLTESIVTFFPDEDARKGFPDASGVPTVLVAPTVKPYFSIYPMPNDQRLGGGVGRNIAPQFLPTNENFISGRFDHKLSDKDSIFARYTYDDATGREGQETQLFQNENSTNQQYLTVVGTHIFSLSAISVFRFGYARPNSGAQIHSEIDIPRSLYFDPGASKFGQIIIPGLSTVGPTNNVPRDDNFDSFQLGTQFLLQRGPNAFKFGVDAHRYRWDLFSDLNVGGIWTLNSLRGFLQAGPVGTNLQIAVPGSNNHRLFRQDLISFYVQDDHRVSARLQVNFGVRYEVPTKIVDLEHKNVFIRDLTQDKQIQLGDYFTGNPSLKSVAPRFGLTWSPRDDHKTVISIGSGIYYDPILGYVTSSRRSSTPAHNIAVNPSFDSSQIFPNALLGAAGVPFLAQVMDHDHMTSPIVVRYNLSIQQTLPGGWNLQTAYVGARGNHLLRRFEANQYPVPVIRSDGSLFFPAGAGAINPAFGSVTTVTSDAQSFYNALQVTANRALRAGLSLQGSYTYSKSVDDSSVGHATNAGQYPQMRTLDRALSDFDIRHRLTFNYFYSSPFGGKGSGWVASHLAAGWRVGGIMSIRTGTPFSVASNVRYRDYLFAANRPNLLPGSSNNPIKGQTLGCGRIPAGQKLGTPDLYFDPCAFSVAPPGTIGNVGRNTLTAPHVFNMDISVQRDFSVDTKRRLQFRADIFNILNHANFAGPSTNVFSGEAGDRSSTAARISKTSTTARQIQFALRFSF